MKRLPVLILLLLTGIVRSQNHPELHWQVRETEHFDILYHQGLEGAAERAARIAEDAYGPVTALYGYEPGGKVRIVLKDYDDYANGAAYYYQDTIEIWGTSLDHDFDLRGTTDWLSNVITHEFTHIISLGAARKTSQRIPAVYLQYFNYQRERNRPDVLVGYPDAMVSYPLMTTVVPMWFAEGVAQYQAAGARHDRWDSHRDMILRDAVLDGAALQFEHMCVFGKKHFGNEYVYDHGFGLVRYIAGTYGEDKLGQISRGVATWANFSVGRAIEKSLGVTTGQLYADWLATLRKRYESQVVALGELVLGKEVVGEGFSNLYPRPSPDGKRFAYLTTGKQHFGPHSLIVRDLKTGDEEVVATAVAAMPASWSPDGRRLVFVRKTPDNPNRSRQADLYEYDFDVYEPGWRGRPALGDFETPRIRRLSRGLRALYPAYSPDGQYIAFVRNAGTSNNLGIVRADGTGPTYLTDLSDGTQLYTPAWSPDGRQLALSISVDGERDIVLLDVNRRLLPPLAPALRFSDEDASRRAGSESHVVRDFGEKSDVPFRVLVASPDTERDPTWSTDGRQILFSADNTGIFNIYGLDLASGRLRQITNVVGGALQPAVAENDTVFFVAYEDRGYEIRLIEKESVVTQKNVGYVPHSGAAIGIIDRASSVLSAERPDLKAIGPARPYSIDFLKTSILPRLMVDEGHFKTGFYLGADDALGKHNLFAGLAMAPGNGDRDVFAIYDIRKWRPTISIEYFHQRRHSGRQDSTTARDLVVTGMSFSLNQLAVAARGRLGRSSELAVSATFDQYDASLASRFFDALNVGWRWQKPFGYTYLKGLGLGLAYSYESFARRRDRDISPRGRRLSLRYDRMFNYFIESFNESNVSFLEEEYLGLFYNQFTLDWHEYIGLPASTTVGLRFYGGWIASDAVDNKELINDFFDYHIGGLNFMKGYTFYSIEGRKAAMATATWRFPIFPDLRKRLAHLYFDKIYGAVYGDVGKAWDGELGAWDVDFQRRGPLRDVGAQLRFDLVSYYSVPTRVQLDLAYGVDEVVAATRWKYYLTVLFGYL